MTAPIEISELKKYFINKDTYFIVDYSNSQLKGQRLLTYIGNLDLPLDLVNFDEEFLKDYLYTSSLTNIPSVELEIIKILFNYKGINKQAKYDSFCSSNTDILDKWWSKLDSLSLFNMKIVNIPEFDQFVSSFEENSTNDPEGINFVSLLKHSEFYEWFLFVDNTKLKNYSSLFNEYLFKGKNLYSFWSNENNLMFLLTWGISSGNLNVDELMEIRKAQNND